MSRPLWFVKILKKAFPRRFLLARLTRLPIVDRIVEHVFFGGDEMIYVPHDRAVRKVQVGEPIVEPESVMVPSQVVEHFIEKANYHWIMNTCICREANQCKDYPIELGCLFLGEAAAGINPKLGRRVSKEEALQHVRRCREVGLVHVIGRNKLDTVWLGIGPSEKLLTICNCCPCCCLWGTLPHMTPHISSKVMRMEGVSVSINGQCVGCGLCTQNVCFVDAIHILDGHATISEDCRGCGRCVEVCPHGAIRLSLEEDHLVERAIARISPLVDVS